MMESKRRQFLRTVGLLAGGTLAASAGVFPNSRAQTFHGGAHPGLQGGSTTS